MSGILIPPITPSPDEPIYETLANQIKQLAAQLPPHTQLPSIRKLARDTGLSPSTVVAAFDLAASAGVIYKRRGSGCYVAPSLSSKRIPVDDEFIPRELPPITSISHWGLLPPITSPSKISKLHLTMYLIAIVDMHFLILNQLGICRSG